MRAAAALLLIAVMSFACTPSRSTPAATDRHVFIIVMENHTPEQALSGSFMASLASKYAVAENYHAITHPSVPNYLALTSGSTWGVTDDSFHVLPRSDLGTQLTNASVSWRAYMDGMVSGQCIESPAPYDPGHNPFAYYGGQCPSNVVPHDALAADLAGDTPRLVWITPDDCHNTHSCEIAVGDEWLRGEVAQITASKAFQSDGVLFVTYDEDDRASDNRVLTIVVTPHGSHRTSSRSYTHYSMLATIEDLLGVGRLGQAKSASPMTDLLPSP